MLKHELKTTQSTIKLRYKTLVQSPKLEDVKLALELKNH